ncbi:MAG: preprotein translocase subunit YajC [Nitrospirae bacterium]|nr:preprotein translocase subunit YajC [Nitrospirota bacterium]
MFTDLAYAMGANPQAGQGQGGGLMGFLPLILIFVIFYFMLIRPQQKRAKETKAMIDNLKKGDKVITSGGEYGVVEEVKPSENVKVKYGKGFIASVRTEEDE